ncbi:gamma-type small acid-soluble spore protein [Aquibacillus sp. 3ASR75-11]|uniref:Gamma-type small acid-soluble spore protein n=1 Tax=Terrihalobacillus insolitus TaxID=2950438 RepID=A0A9X4AMS6_9BACI|nr:gamma-type small acid-soluble spore protein [Terrihalobacillus insolitus]MDC3414572.1 gamma-type small acid-soluble spore protein [Terrihalobacillus insolitus]MDC3425752.1 gamma-type small acid-soluble spore protein [Terrihalobacillus insolitus]
MKNNNTTNVGTDIQEVKRKNAQSGMSYNEAKEYIARTTGGHNTKQLSNTDVAQVKRDIHE